MKKLITLSTLFFLALGCYSQVSDATFAKAINSTTDYFTSIKKLSSSEHKVSFLVAGAHPTDKELVVSYTMNALLQNKGDHYIIIASFPPMAGVVYDFIESGKYEYKNFKNTTFEGLGAFKKMGYSYSRGEENNPILVLKKEFGAKSAIPIMGGMVKTINRVKELYGGFAYHQRSIIRDKLKAFEKSKLSQVENNWLPILADWDNLYKYAKTPPDGIAGYWSFVYNKIAMDLIFYNHKDRFEIIITRDVGDGNGEKFLSEIENFIGRNKYKKASSTESITLQNGRHAGVKVTYAYDGKTTGEDLLTGIDEVYNYSNRLSKVYQ